MKHPVAYIISIQLITSVYFVFIKLYNTCIYIDCSYLYESVPTYSCHYLTCLCIERIVIDNTNAFSFLQLYIKWTPPLPSLTIQNSLQQNVITQNPVIKVILKNKFVFKLLINLIKPANSIWTILHHSVVLFGHLDM